MGYIYRIWHKESGKSYIGKSMNNPLGVNGRINKHLTRSAIGCKAMCSAVKKYGKDAFDYEVMYKGVPEHALDKLETACIRDYGTFSPNGYNLIEGGGTGLLSDETKAKISMANMGGTHSGFPHTDESKAKIGEANKGNVPWNKGVPHSEETKQKISESLRRRTHAKVYRIQRAAVIQANRVRAKRKGYKGKAN